MTDHEGLRLMAVEMGRQCGDALTTLDANRSVAERIAADIQTERRLVLYGIGGSHYVNRMVEPLYREAGIECRAMSPSEALMAPLPADGRVALFASQSGESGEIVELLKTPAGRDRRCGMTLAGESTLARHVDKVMVASGGPENAFAASRSIILTVAMHAAVLKELGIDAEPLSEILATDAPADMAKVDQVLADCDTIVFAGRHVMQGVAQSAALSLMELARVPAIGLESGQFRHGPFEFLRPGIGVVLLRSDGPDHPSIAPIARTCVEAGCSTMILDAGNGDLPEGVLSVRLPRGKGLAAATSMLLSLQQLNIAVAKRTVREAIGTPRFTSKVTI